MDVSESTEMYLIKTALLQEAGGHVPVPQLADELGITQVSVNQMCRKLQDQGLLEYLPYKGVALTDSGQALANQVIRRRRLWEVFLVGQLELSLPDAEAAACMYEHVTTDEIADRLSTFLDHPTTCPHNEPIPRGPNDPAARSSRTLASLAAGDRCRVVKVLGDDVAGGFLRAQGIAPSAQLTVQAVADNGPVLVATGDGLVSLTRSVAENVEVEPP